MSYIGWILIFLAIAAFAMFAIVIVRFNLKRRHIARCLEVASDKDLEATYRLIEELGSEAPKSYVAARTNRVAGNERSVIKVPTGLEPFPWAGSAFEYVAGDPPSFRHATAIDGECRFRGRIHRLVAIPRRRTKSGKLRNTFFPPRYFSASEALRSQLATLCPEYPGDFLGYLLCAGRHSFEFDQVSQARIGTSIEWIQDPEFPFCSVCRKRMTPILQVPGYLPDPERYAECNLYLFGCTRHSGETKTVIQCF